MTYKFNNTYSEDNALYLLSQQVEIYVYDDDEKDWIFIDYCEALESLECNKFKIIDKTLNCLLLVDYSGVLSFFKRTLDYTNSLQEESLDDFEMMQELGMEMRGN